MYCKKISLEKYKILNGEALTRAYFEPESEYL